MDLGLKGKNAAITGSSQGIGYAIATALAREGCNIALSARGEQRLSAAVKDMQGLGVKGMERDVTASFGIACFPDDAVDASAIMRCADRALYAAKRGGRNRIEASSTGAPVKADA